MTSVYTRHSDPVTDALKHRLQARLHRFSKRRLCQRTDQSVFTQNQSPRTEITGSVTKAPLLVSQPLGLCVGTTRICNPCSRSKLLPKIPVAHGSLGRAPGRTTDLPGPLPERPGKCDRAQGRPPVLPGRSPKSPGSLAGVPGRCDGTQGRSGEVPGAMFSVTYGAQGQTSPLPP